MSQEPMDKAARLADYQKSPTIPDSGADGELPTIESAAEIVYCTTCGLEAGRNCYRCGANLCETHSYREVDGTLDYCRDCADALVGVCAVCEALHARPCRECGMKVCELHQKRVIERWGWGGMPGQGGVLDWFPMVRIYCQEHGRDRFDLPRPIQKTLSGYDGSSPEW